LPVSEASTVPFSLSQFGAVGLRIILALQQWQDETIVPWHFATFVKETSVLGGERWGGVHGRDQYTQCSVGTAGPVKTIDRDRGNSSGLAVLTCNSVFL